MTQPAEVTVSVVDDLATLEAIGGEWKRLHASDPVAASFYSYEWVCNFIRERHPAWFIYVATDQNGAVVGILPCEWIDRSDDDQAVMSNLAPKTADRCSVVIDPAASRLVIESLAREIARDGSIQKIRFRGMHDPRMRQLAVMLSQSSFTLQEQDSTRCPVIELPDSAEAYLENLASKSHRKNLRYYTRKLTGLNGYQQRTSDSSSDLERLITDHIWLFEQRRGQRPQPYRDLIASIIRALTPLGAARLIVNYDDDVPVASIFCILDREHGTVSHYNGGVNQDYEKLSAGNVTVLQAINYAIENGYRHFDFLRGEEDYKYKFGAIDTYNENFDLVRKSSLISRTAKSIIRLIR